MFINYVLKGGENDALPSHTPSPQPTLPNLKESNYLLAFWELSYNYYATVRKFKIHLGSDSTSSS